MRVSFFFLGGAALRVYVQHPASDPPLSSRCVLSYVALSCILSSSPEMVDLTGKMMKSEKGKGGWGRQLKNPLSVLTRQSGLSLGSEGEVRVGWKVVDSQTKQGVW